MDTPAMDRLPFAKPEKPIRDPKFITAYKRSHPRCEACGKRPTEDAHHLRSKQMSGSDIEENVIALCRRCHREWADVNKTRAMWFAKYAPTMTDETREKVARALRIVA